MTFALFVELFLIVPKLRRVSFVPLRVRFLWVLKTLQEREREAEGSFVKIVAVGRT
jgi:hypothetical protein